jgi:meso-butanediol dehydrogenase / (S,S)-butanediol dehydrogenase / diacetyl reductase
MSALQGKVMLVTGASSGLGAETARLLSREGATVFGIGRDTGRLAEVFADVEHGSYASVDGLRRRPAGTRSSGASASWAD